MRRHTICAAAAAAASAVLGSIHDSVADGRMAVLGGETADQKPLVQGSSGETEGIETFLRDIVNLEDLDFGEGGIDVDSQGPQGCVACETLLLGLKAAAIKGDETFVHTLIELCKRLQVQDPDVCEGAIAREGPIAAHALRKMTPGWSHTSRLFCVATLGFCSYPDVKVDKLSFPSPKPDGAKRPPPTSGKKPLKVVHYSDIHVDPFYVAGANVDCSKPICCRNYSITNPPSPHDVPAGPNGDHRCDVPVSLEDSMYAAIARLVPDAAFAIFTGDVVDHAVWNTTRAQNVLDIEDAYGRMTTALPFVVYGTAGNHEADPTNSFRPSTVGDGGGEEGKGGDGTGGAQWLYDLLSSTWSQWIGPENAIEARRFGAFSARHATTTANHYTEPLGQLRIISLNTNLFYRHNLWLYEEPMQQDPSGQLAWLVDELDAAERAGDRVYIVGHMPLGSADAFHEASHYLDQVVNRYEGTIAALFFGHTHHDEFQISYNDYENRKSTNAVAMSYIAPSLTPTSGHPSFRVYDVDPVTFGILDVTTYIANMSDPDFQTPKGPRWTKYYSAKEAYGPLVPPPLSMATSDNDDDDVEKSAIKGEEVEAAAVVVKELTPAFWHNVTEALQRNATAFGEYLARKRRGWRPDGDGDEKCAGSEECVGAEICRLRGARAQDNCAKPSSGLGRVSSGRRGEKKEMAGELVDAWRDEEETADECEVSVVRDTLAGVGVVFRALAAL